jgi:hypothetical protein
MNPGDRIQIIKVYGNAKVGMTGTFIKESCNDMCIIEFDEKDCEAFHDCLGTTKDCHGYLVPKDKLLIIQRLGQNYSSIPVRFVNYPSDQLKECYIILNEHGESLMFKSGTYWLITNNSSDYLHYPNSNWNL